ncbi:E3 ubiquitin-protein ligase [Podospora fimiseda]|uniref:RING-type E3 ubiquitin transferase n=1 Tax=Podospora fimiseda TaxID=252190 RepID=A0AAN7H1E7_9PEZI|nr:E3 ubiquitin-protein ligase [Podospora fimiseda]
MDTDPDDNDIQSQVLQTTLASIESNNNEETNCCVICLDTITEPCTSLPCSHTNFDFICLLNWLQQRPSCPLCKASIIQVQYTDPNKSGPQKPSIYSVPEPQPSPTSTHPPPPQPSPYPHFPPHRRRHRSLPRPPPSPDSALSFRRHIYLNNLYSLHVGSNPTTQYLPSAPSPSILSSTPHILSRARLWIRRELQVFTHLSSNREFLLEYIIAILKTVDIQGSTGQAEAMLSDFLLDRDHARLFLHELKSWLRSPARTVELWDREVKYPDVNKKRWDDGEDEEEERRRKRVEEGKSWVDEEGGDHWRAVTEGREENKRLGTKRRERDVLER